MFNPTSVGSSAGGRSGQNGSQPGVPPGTQSALMAASAKIKRKQNSPKVGNTGMESSGLKSPMSSAAQ